jgi:hypothetical protein
MRATNAAAMKGNPVEEGSLTAAALGVMARSTRSLPPRRVLGLVLLDQPYRAFLHFR